MADEEKKIIIDEDWKSQVQAEKESRESGEQRGDEADAASGAPGEFQMPPASFEMLLSTLVTEAMVALGRVPNPATQKPEINLDQAKYFVDTIEVLEEKTRGNLTDDEAQGLTGLLHQLRMLYVTVQNEVAAKKG